MLSLFPAFTTDPKVPANLFSPYSLFVDRAALDAMGRVAATVFDVAANPRYRQHVLQWAPDIATHEPGSAGGVLGLDFHLTVDGPRLIERSEEHTSELQSLMRISYAVFCLKKKKIKRVRQRTR